MTEQDYSDYQDQEAKILIAKAKRSLAPLAQGIPASITLVSLDSEVNNLNPTPMKDYCTMCKRTVMTKDGDLYCWYCGTELIESAICECGRDLTSADQFCPRCGKKTNQNES